jgi:hypothetical protein
MSFHEYLHERAEESRHNETLAYLVFLAGTIFFIGGILETITLTQNPAWFILLPYNVQPDSGSVLGLILIFSGLAMAVFGIAAGISFGHDRGWYLRELASANSASKQFSKQKITKTDQPLQQRKREQKVV